MIEYNKLLNDIIITQTGIYNPLNLFIFIVLSLLISIAIDIIMGELPTEIHPVVIIGSIIGFFKNMFIKITSRISGLLLVICTVLLVSVTLYILYSFAKFSPIILFVLFSVLLSSSFSIKMLLKTASDVKDDLNESLDKARKTVSYLVSRSTDELTESFIVSATIESLTENITDSYVAPIFYYFIFALVIMFHPMNECLYYLLLIPILYRTFNTLDAMVGYENDELKDIGFFPAKIDDILNFVPSRISGIYVVISAYLLKLDWKNSYRIMMRDARNCPSPNSGYTMASAAGALNIQLIKKDTYILGDENKNIEINDIGDAVRLSRMTIILFTMSVLLLLIIFEVIL